MRGGCVWRFLTRGNPFMIRNKLQLYFALYRLENELSFLQISRYDFKLRLSVDVYVDCDAVGALW